MAARRIASPRDCEEVVHATIGSPVRLKLKSGFANRPVDGDKKWNLIDGAFFLAYRHLGIHEGTQSTDRWLRMTAGTTVQVEPGSKTNSRAGDCAMNRFHLLKGRQALAKKQLFGAV